MGKWYHDEDIESILFDYPTTKAEAMLEQEKLINLFPSCTASYSGEPNGTGISNQTANLAVKRAEGSLPMKRVRAIEIAYEALDGECKEMVQAYYFERRRLWNVCAKLNISERQFYRLRRITLDKFARLLLRSIA